jgi:hypothetical protein
MRKFSLLCCICLLGCFSVQAQQKKYVYEDTSVALPPPQNDPAELYDDEGVSTVVEAPKEDEEKVFVEKAIDTSLYPNQLVIANDTVQQVKTMEQLAYARYLDSMLRAAQDNQKKGESKQQEQRLNFDPPSVSLGFLTPILWILGIGFVGFILYTLFLRDGAFRKNTKKAPVSEEAQPEEVKPGSDMDRLIRQALQNKNYRLAIRYQYLNCLYKLAEKGLVQFAVDKTNYQYVSELTNAQLRNEFAKLTLHYEYAWYGEFDIDEPLYQKIEPGLTAFYNKI